MPNFIHLFVMSILYIDCQDWICILRVPDQNGTSQTCFIVKIYHSGGDAWCNG